MTINFKGNMFHHTNEYWYEYGFCEYFHLDSWRKYCYEIFINVWVLYLLAIQTNDSMVFILC